MKRKTKFAFIKTYGKNTTCARKLQSACAKLPNFLVLLQVS